VLQLQYKNSVLPVSDKYKNTLTGNMRITKFVGVQRDLHSKVVGLQKH